MLKHVNTCDVSWINLLWFNTRTQLQLIKTDGKVKVSDSPNELTGAFRTIHLANLLMFALGYFHLQAVILMFTFAIKHAFRYMGFVLQLMSFGWKSLLVFHYIFFFLPKMLCLLKREKIRVKYMFKDIII